MAACQGPCSHVLQESSAKQIQEPVEQAVPKHHHHQYITRYEDLRSIQQSWRNARNITKPKKTRYQTHRAGRPEESMFKRYLEWSSGPLQGVERWRRTCHCDCSWRRFPTFERFRTGQTGDPVTQMPRPL